MGESDLARTPIGLVCAAALLHPMPWGGVGEEEPNTMPTTAVPTQSLPTVMWGCCTHPFTSGSYLSMDDNGTLPSCPPMMYICPPNTAVPSPLRGFSMGLNITHWSRLGMYSSIELSRELEVSVPPITKIRLDKHSAPGNFLHVLMGDMVDQVAVKML